MADALFEIGADGIDAEKIVAEIRDAVAQKTRDGVYADARVARAERTNLAALRTDETFMDFYLDCLRESVFVDISDFDIHERRRFLARPLVLFKRVVWNLLKFYTYRLWSQQNQVNGLLVSAAEGIDAKYRDRIKSLEERVARLESNRPDDAPAP